MTVHTLDLSGFRNYRQLSIQFVPGVNVIYGDNAQGKTNLLEAVGYLSGAHSHRARADRELICFDQSESTIRASLESRSRLFQVEARLIRGQRRRLLVNGVRLKSASQLSGVLHTVLFCPEDLMLIREGASARRRFLDTSICQLRPRYAQALGEYNRLLEHKTRILRDWEEKPSLLDTLEDFNDRLARTGAIVIHYRAHYIQKLAHLAGDIQTDFSGGRESLELAYQTVKTVSDPLASTKLLYTQLQQHQASHRQVELEARSCLSGPHRDDLVVNINGRPARQYASQGQTRTAALSLKLAERDLHSQDIGEWPVLLLDDVLSELDPKRKDFVLRRITGGQVFITCCQEEGLSELGHGRAFMIKDGSIASEV